MATFTSKPFQLAEDVDIIGTDCHVHREIHQELRVATERPNHNCL